MLIIYFGTKVQIKVWAGIENFNFLSAFLFLEESLVRMYYATLAGTLLYIIFYI